LIEHLSLDNTSTMADNNSGNNSAHQVVILDGEGLTVEQLMSLEQENVKVDLSQEAWDRVKSGRQVVDDILKDPNQKVYGINTGFGLFSNVGITPENLAALQLNLIRSHAVGVGPYLTPSRTRRLLALRINVLAKGRSGIRSETLQQLIDALNKWCLPAVPEKGTVGASGDLAPLAHLALGLVGEGKIWNPQTKSLEDAGSVLQAHGLKPIELGAKEGLALINGTQLITSLGAEAVYRAENCSLVADVAGALTLESLKGTVVAFNEMIHKARPHTGQLEIARRLRSLLHTKEHPSEIYVSHANCGVVQDSYTLRCIPQVHGIAFDTINFVKGIISTEMNSATDNPMVFSENKKIMSGGNFHGEYPAKAMDYLAIGVHELANISERRIERLNNPALSALPAFLSKDGGLNSGFMIAHCTAASLVSENKVLCHPSSVDSISTSAAKEDHVSMGGWAARKALTVVEHVEIVLAIEIMCACQAIEFHRPLKTTEALEKVHALVRSVVPKLEKDRFLQPDVEAIHQLIKSGKIAEAVRPYVSS